MSCVAGEEVGFGDDDRAEMRLMVIKQGMHARMTPSPGPTSVPVAQEYLPATAAQKPLPSGASGNKHARRFQTAIFCMAT